MEARHLRVRLARTLDVLLELHVHLGTSLNPYHLCGRRNAGEERPIRLRDGDRSQKQHKFSGLDRSPPAVHDLCGCLLYTSDAADE